MLEAVKYLLGRLLAPASFIIINSYGSVSNQGSDHSFSTEMSEIIESGSHHDFIPNIFEIYGLIHSTSLHILYAVLSQASLSSTLCHAPLRRIITGCRDDLLLSGLVRGGYTALYKLYIKLLTCTN